MDAVVDSETVVGQAYEAVTKGPSRETRDLLLGYA